MREDQRQVDDGQGIPPNLFADDMPEAERTVPDDEETAPPSLDEGGERHEIESSVEAQNARNGTAEQQAEARSSGWVDRDEWSGPPDKWKPATEFLEFRDHVLPLVQRENRTLRSTVAQLQARLDAQDRERAEYQAKFQRDSLMREMAEAQREQNWDLANELMVKAMGIQVPQKPQNSPVDAETRRLHDEFVGQNKWLSDPRLKGEWYRQLALIAQTNTAATVPEALDIARDTVRRLFPEKFRQAPRISMAEGNVSHDTGRSNGKSWANLNPSIRRDFEDQLAGMRLSGKALEESKKRILDRCDDSHFRR